MTVQVNIAEAKAKLYSRSQSKAFHAARSRACRRRDRHRASRQATGTAHSHRKYDATQAWRLARFEDPERWFEPMDPEDFDAAEATHTDEFGIAPR
jgi:hypothetical protein